MMNDKNDVKDGIVCHRGFVNLYEICIVIYNPAKYFLCLDLSAYLRIISGYFVTILSHKLGSLIVPHGNIHLKRQTQAR